MSVMSIITPKYASMMYSPVTPPNPYTFSYYILFKIQTCAIQSLMYSSNLCTEIPESYCYAVLCWHNMGGELNLLWCDWWTNATWTQMTNTISKSFQIKFKFRDNNNNTFHQIRFSSCTKYCYDDFLRVLRNVVARVKQLMGPRRIEKSCFLNSENSKNLKFSSKNKWIKNNTITISII